MPCGFGNVWKEIKINIKALLKESLNTDGQLILTSNITKKTTTYSLEIQFLAWNMQKMWQG
jgi:hypothetical protein